jgi:glucose/arabinose dehydrogenase
MFPGWKNNILVGNLKGRSLVRMVLDGNKVVQHEMLLEELARVRDIEVGSLGEIYLLLENYNGAKILRMVPAT